MLRIRLRRVGKKKQPSYRIVVADARAPRDGAIVDQVGHYSPLTDPPTVVVNQEKVKRWLDVGAKPSDTVGRLIQRYGSAASATAVAEPPAAEEAAPAAAIAEEAVAVEEPAAVAVEEPAAEVEDPAAVVEEADAVAEADAAEKTET